MFVFTGCATCRVEPNTAAKVFTEFIISACVPTTGLVSGSACATVWLLFRCMASVEQFENPLVAEISNVPFPAGLGHLHTSRHRAYPSQPCLQRRSHSLSELCLVCAANSLRAAAACAGVSGNIQTNRIVKR